MKKQSILESIYKDVDSINWSTETVKQKAIFFISTLFDVFIYKYKSLDSYMNMSTEYWTKLIQGKTTHIREIKSKLISNNILEETFGLYKKDPRVKSYKFNIKYINNIYNIHNLFILVVPFSKPLEINQLQEIENKTKNIISNIKIKGNNIGTIVEEQLNNHIEKGNNIGTTYIDLKLDLKVYRYKTENAIKLAKELNKEIIRYKNKYYLADSIEEFKNYKRNELIIIYTKQLFDIENGIIYASRNKTNNRLDSNVTNLKSDLWKYLTLDNEEMIEIDIANAQFAIAANIIESDESFKELAISGKLYKYVSNELNITEQEAKKLMFRIAFDKVKEEQDCIRNIFPIFMNSVDTYKKEKGYDLFSNLLQKAESNLMIDNVLYTLLEEGYQVLSVHDSIRCKKSDYEKVLNRILEIFNTINFKCTLKNKTSKDVKNEKQDNILEKEETVLEATKEMYYDYLKQKSYGNVTNKDFLKYKDVILNELVKLQPKKYIEIKEIIFKIIN